LISFIFVGFEVFTAVVMKSIIFWDITSCSPLSFNRRFGGKYRLPLRWCVEPISSIPKMEAVCSSETSVETQRTARRHIPEDDTLPLDSFTFTLSSECEQLFLKALQEFYITILG
jgi:hypothetical protein